MKPALEFLRNILRFHKLKIVATIGFAIVFFILYFPYDDLGNLLTTKIYDGSAQQVYVQAKDLELGIIPVPGIQASDVNIEPGAAGATFTPLHLDSLSIRPMLLALLSLRGGASIDATGVFGGEASLSAQMGSTFFASEPGPIEIRGLTLRDVTITQLLAYVLGGQPSFKIGGRISAESNLVSFDPTYKKPIAGDLGLIIEGLTLPTTIPIPGFGEFADLPQVKITKADIRTQIGDNKVRITQGTLGTSTDPIYGRVLGEMELRPIPGGGMAPGQFNICVEINVSQAFYDALAKRLGSAIQLIASGADQFRRRDEQGNKYGFVATGPSLADFQNADKKPGNCKNFAGPN